MNYSAALDYIHSKLPMFHRTGKVAYKNNLDNINALDAHLGSPHKSFKTIHIAGTNGKGSVSHMLSAVLQTAGFKTGLFTSPHLVDFRERIRVNGQMIPEEDVAIFVTELYDVFEEVKPSFFEMTVALAFKFFQDQHVDIAVIETGLGGRLDSTNIINPLVSIITNISLDHTDILGKTLEAIATEKAGIIKPGIPTVIGESNNAYNEVFKKTADEKHSDLIFADTQYFVDNVLWSLHDKQIMFVRKEGKELEHSFKLDLLGNYQQKNLVTVLTSIDVLRKTGISIPEENVLTALEKVSDITGLMGRWQILGQNPLIICDTGHNEEGIRWVVSQLKRTAYNHLHFVFGMVNDKDTDSILKQLPQQAGYYFTRANLPRAMDENVLANAAGNFNLKGQTFASVEDAYNAARQNAQTDDLIFIGGSSFVVAEVLSLKK
jgi:dihydrofolate synthase / folylpolyglutamate synthase